MPAAFCTAAMPSSFDLRGNGGGDSDAADYFAKAFVDPNSGKPIYILVDGHVASAAEAVAYGVQAGKAAIVVGSTTYGAANNNKKLPIAPAFVLSVSYNRPINPITKTNWEGTGVVPDIAVPGSTALPAAELSALAELSAMPGIADTQRAEYAWARQGVEAQLHPVKLSNAKLARYAGRYGTIVIRVVNGQLRLTRTDRPRWEKNIVLVPLDAKRPVRGYRLRRSAPTFSHEFVRFFVRKRRRPGHVFAELTLLQRKSGITLSRSHRLDVIVRTRRFTR
jgi:hypothetical protein